MTDTPYLQWLDGDVPGRARWRSLADVPVHSQVQVADERMSADTAFRLINQGVALLWQGDFHQAKQMLQALARRLDRRQQRKSPKAAISLQQTHALHRQAQAVRARTLGMILLPFEADHQIALRRAPDARLACLEAHGPVDEPYVASLRELQGIVGAHEWRKRGVEVPALSGRIHAHYGVFSPLRGEYLDLVAQAPLPAALTSHDVAYDIGTGTGVLAAILAKRGVARIVATDLAPRALACAQDNLTQLGLIDRVELRETDLFPEGQAGLIVCNPPWVPGRPSSSVEQAVYDPHSQMLRGFLKGLRAHLAPGGEGWLILSDLAEHLGLRSRDDLLSWVDEAGLMVLAKHDIRPVHGKSRDVDDPLHAARAAEVTSLWRLCARP